MWFDPFMYACVFIHVKQLSVKFFNFQIHIFVKFNYNRVEWWAYEDNPAIRGYDAFIKRCGGRRAGYLRQNIKLMDGKIHNSIIYEILREDYIKNSGKRYDKK